MGQYDNPIEEIPDSEKGEGFHSVKVVNRNQDQNLEENFKFPDKQE